MWSNTIVPYDKHLNMFWLNDEHQKLVPDPFMILLK